MERSCRKQWKGKDRRKDGDSVRESKCGKMDKKIGRRKKSNCREPQEKSEQRARKRMLERRRKEKERKYRVRKRKMTMGKEDGEKMEWE